MYDINEEFKNNNKVNLIRFNQDFTLFSMGTDRGYKIYETYPMSEFHEKILFGGISLCEMSYNSNYLALVGGGTIPKFTNKKVVLYNDAEDCIESEFKFTTPVLNVKLKKNLLFVICEKKIYVFNVENSQNIDSFDTIINKGGIIAINGSPDKTIMAHPIEFNDQPDKGYVGIKNYKTNKYFPLLVHEEPISNMCIDYYGLMLATSNDKGTLIRIHSCADQTLLYECKRGKDKVNINYISFDMEYKYIGTSSDKGTLHIWKLNDIVEKGYSKKDAKINEREEVIVTKNIENDFVSIETNYKNNINDINNNEIYIEIYKLKKIKYPKIESSFARIKINKPDCIFCFLPGDLVLIITSEAKFCFAKIEKKGGYCIFTEEKEIKKK